MLDRRMFLQATAASAVLSVPAMARAKLPDLKIARIRLQEAKGRRLTPVARNAYADYRGYDVSETVLRITSANGVEGVARAARSDPALLKQLIGLDAAALFSWNGDRIAGPAPEHAALLEKLRGTDIALVDMIGRARKMPAHALLGQSMRDQILVYDSSLYMEDLLTPEQLTNIAYLKGRSAPTNPVELPAVKAEWILRTRPEGFKALKIKTGRSRWMPSRDEALQRDIDITNAIRRAVGPDIRLMIDANKDYAPTPQQATRYAAAVRDADVYMLEELFPETQTDALVELRRSLRAAGNPVKLAYGESHNGGIPTDIYKRRFAMPGGADQPLIDIEQADMNHHGFLYLQRRADAQRPLGMTMAPHNFGSKLGLYAQVHLAMVVPNWDICELDDSNFPAIRADGIQIANGMARSTGNAGIGVTLVEEHLSPPKLDLS